jgi:hypothetical protein
LRSLILTQYPPINQVGHWELGIGHGAWGIGHGELGILDIKDNFIDRDSCE